MKKFVIYYQTKVCNKEKNSLSLLIILIQRTSKIHPVSNVLSFSSLLHQLAYPFVIIPPSFPSILQSLIKLMISTNNPVPQVNFWQELVIKVQEIEHRTNQQTPPQHVPREQSIKKKRFSRFQVQNTWHRSQEESMTLANRIKYLQIQQQRHNRTLQLARQKYERMMAIRQRSLREKDECKKKITELNEEISKEVTEKVSKAKQERFRVSQSVQKVRAKNENQAKKLREFTNEIQKTLRQEREMEVEQKKYKVESARQSVEKSRMRLSNLQEDRVLQGKIQHKQTIRKQMTLNLQQHRRNSLLRQKLEESIISAHNSKKETINLLQEYQTIMVPSSKGRATSESQSRPGSYPRPISLTLTT